MEIQQLRDLSLMMTTSGTAIPINNTKLYQGGFGFVLLKAFVPITQQRSPSSAPLCQTYRTVIDNMGNRKQFNNDIYNLMYVENVTIKGEEYMRFECPLPKDYTATAGDLEILVYYSEVREDNTVDARLMSNIYKTTVEPGGPSSGETIDPTGGELARLNELTIKVDQLEDSVDALLAPPDVSDANKVGVVDVSITPDGNLKFSNLKGETGDKGNTGGKGDKGDTGLIALECAVAVTLSTGTVPPETQDLTVQSFNRVPVLGDIVNILFEAGDNNTYTTLYSVTDVALGIVSLNRIAFFNTRGATGPAGPIGPTGLKYLIYLETLNLTEAPVEGNYISASSGLCNRTPQRDDSIFVAANYQGITYNLIAVIVVPSDPFSAMITSIQVTKGDTGKDALTFNTVLTTDTTPVQNDQRLLPISFFNRTPVIDDTFILYLQTTMDGKTYMCMSRITSVDNTNATTVIYRQPTETTGATGATGPQGQGITIKDSYESYDDFIAAHPTGSPGDAYIVAGYLYVWDSTAEDWDEVGYIQGPQGVDGRNLYRVSSTLLKTTTSINASSIIGVPQPIGGFKIGEYLLDNGGNMFVVTSNTPSTSTTVPISYRYSIIGPIGPVGPQGDTGPIALEYLGDAFSTQTNPVVGQFTPSMYVEDIPTLFNRTPILNQDSCVFLYNRTESDQYDDDVFLVTAKCTTLTASLVRFTITGVSKGLKNRNGIPTYTVSTLNYSDSNQIAVVNCFEYIENITNGGMMFYVRVSDKNTTAGLTLSSANTPYTFKLNLTNDSLESIIVNSEEFSQLGQLKSNQWDVLLFTLSGNPFTQTDVTFKFDAKFQNNSHLASLYSDDLPSTDTAYRFAMYKGKDPVGHEVLPPPMSGAYQVPAIDSRGNLVYGGVALSPENLAAGDSRIILPYWKQRQYYSAVITNPGDVLSVKDDGSGFEFKVSPGKPVYRVNIDLSVENQPIVVIPNFSYQSNLRSGGMGFYLSHTGSLQKKTISSVPYDGLAFEFQNEETYRHVHSTINQPGTIVINENDQIFVILTSDPFKPTNPEIIVSWSYDSSKQLYEHNIIVRKLGSVPDVQYALFTVTNNRQEKYATVDDIIDLLTEMGITETSGKYLNATGIADRFYSTDLLFPVNIITGVAVSSTPGYLILRFLIEEEPYFLNYMILFNTVIDCVVEQ